jgi:hypothetical protein
MVIIDVAGNGDAVLRKCEKEGNVKVNPDTGRTFKRLSGNVRPGTFIAA